MLQINNDTSSSQTGRTVYKSVSASVSGGKDQKAYLRLTSDPDYLYTCSKSETMDTHALDKGICFGDLPVQLIHLLLSTNTQILCQHVHKYRVYR